MFGKVWLEDEQSSLYTYIYSYPVYASLSLQIPFPFSCKIKKKNLDTFYVYINRHILVSLNVQDCCINKAMGKMGHGENKGRIVNLDT